MGLDELEELDSLNKPRNRGLNSEVLCYILKDTHNHSVIGGRFKSYIEAMSVKKQFPDRKGLVIYKVILDDGKRIFEAM